MRRLALLFCVLGCSSPNNGNGADAPSGGDGNGSNHIDASIDGQQLSYARTIFVIPMENEPSTAIYGNTTYAPYINGLLTTAAQTTMFQDELPLLPSEPHYVWMEAGTNAFSDITITSDADATTSHSTTSTAHLVTQLQTANISWMSYQEGITSHTCPISSSSGSPNFYAAKHDPFVFFKDVIGTPVGTGTICTDHHKSYADFAADIMGPLPRFVFITPNLCHDMHGATGCAGSSVNANIKAGDDWLAAELPRIIAYAQAHDGVVFLNWDEGDSSNLIPFLAIGPRIKAGSTSTVVYSHSSMLKSIEEILGVPVLSSVMPANDFADMFQTGMFP